MPHDVTYQRLSLSSARVYHSMTNMEHTTQSERACLISRSTTVCLPLNYIICRMLLQLYNDDDVDGDDAESCRSGEVMFYG